MKILILYYTRTKTLEKVAEDLKDRYQKSDDVEVKVEEIHDRKDRQGVMGYIKGGYDAAKRHETRINPIVSDLSSYDMICIGTPVWASNMAPAIRTVLKEMSLEENLKELAFFCSQGAHGAEKAFGEMEKVSGKMAVAKMAVLQKEVKAQSDKYHEKIDEFIQNCLEV